MQLIESRVKKAAKQLKESGSALPLMPRIVVLFFASRIFVTSRSEVVIFNDITFDGETLWNHIDSMLAKHQSISSIAVMSEQASPIFSVFHNPYLEEVPKLDTRIFDDGKSVQFDSIESIPRVPVEPFDLDKLVNMIVENSTAQGQVALTVDDYQSV